MCNAFLMKIFKTLQQLLDNFFCFFFSDSLIKLSFARGSRTLFFQKIVKALARDVLNNEVNIMVRFEGLRELDHIRVLKFLHKHNLTAHTVTPVLIHQFRLVIDLGCIVLAFALFIRKADHSVSTLTQKPTELVVFIDLIRRPVS